MAMKQKNWWPMIYQFLFGFSAVYAIYCVLHRDSRLPIALACVGAAAVFYAMEVKKHGK